MKIKLKIISGYLKRHSIEITKNENLRPVLTRVRQTIFDILFNLIFIENTLIADICCGSGILGIESLSRGASKCHFFDINKKTIEELKKNCNNLSIFPSCKFWNKNALTPPMGEPLDIIFLDPPYESNFLIKKILRRFRDTKWINEKTILVISMDKKFKHNLLEEYNLLKETTISSSSIYFLQLK